jgi:hypothetical protein
VPKKPKPSASRRSKIKHPQEAEKGGMDDCEEALKRLSRLALNDRLATGCGNVRAQASAPPARACPASSALRRYAFAVMRCPAQPGPTEGHRRSRLQIGVGFQRRSAR